MIQLFKKNLFPNLLHVQMDVTYENYAAFYSFLEVWLAKMFVLSTAFCYLFMVQVKQKRNYNFMIYEVFLKVSYIYLIVHSFQIIKSELQYSLTLHIRCTHLQGGNCYPQQFKQTHSPFNQNLVMVPSTSIFSK